LREIVSPFFLPVEWLESAWDSAQFLGQSVSTRGALARCAAATESHPHIIQCMAIPTQKDCMLPFLLQLKDGRDQHIREVEEALAQRFSLSPNDRAQMLPSG